MLLPKKYKLTSFFALLILFLGCSAKGDWTTIVQAEYDNGQAKIEHKYLIDANDTLTITYFEYHPSGALKIKGNLNNDGNRIGLWEAYYADSTLWSKGSYKNGIEEGKKTVWFSNGQKRYEGNYKNGKQVGVWNYWNEQGKNVHTVTKN